MAFRFKGHHSNNFFLVNTIQRSMLPTITAKLVKASGKIGAYSFGKDIDVSTYDVKATVTAATTEELETRLDEIKTWLHGDEGELVFDFKPHAKYIAQLDGDTPIEPLGTSAFISFTLLCANPIGVGFEEHKYTIKKGEMTADIQNDGTAPTEPNVRIKFTEDAYNISIIGKDSAVTVGTSPDYIKETVPYEERVLYDELIDPQLWKPAAAVDDGIIFGEFESNGYMFHQKGWDYGKSTNWHGASAIRSLDEPLENFMVELHCTFLSWDVGDMGRIEFYLLDQNGKQFGKASMNDVTWLGNHQIAVARFGSQAEGIQFVYDHGAYPGVWQGWHDGIIRLGRKKRDGYVTWFTYFAIRDQKTGRLHTELYREYADYTGRWLQKLAGVQIAVAALGEGDKVYYMTLNHVNVYKYNEGDRTQYNDKPFKADDILEIDMESAAVYLNGHVAADLIDPASDFFALPTGKSQLAIYPAVGDAEITFKNKYL
ncbi:TPA: distal tail protein Dit [Bacillus cereus]|uniref:distal tail protein Dit n=1 Tax=unclassified Bacillus cereus group TaxID=2750818 RepID=UPI00391E2897